MLQRTSSGVAGLEATDRFGATASVLSAFTVLQLAVYAGLQVPAGVLLDRYGSRRLLAAGALVMATGQLVLALAATVPLAVLGRVLVGAGDALTLVSVLRLVATWFPPARVPLVTQLTGILGQAGQVLSVVPLVALLTGPGWTPAFLAAAGAGLLVAAAVVAGVRDAPGVRWHRGEAMSSRRVRDDLASAWGHPGTRLGLWTHLTTQFPGTVFSLTRGYPFLVSAQGLSPGTASALVTTYVVAGAAAGPVLGLMAGRHPLRRSWLVLATVGLEYARTYNPAQRLGTASGLVNIGGFAASLLVVLAVGVVLDLAGGTYDLDGFRAAFSVQYPVRAVGVVGILVARRRVRRRMADEGVVAPAAPLRRRRRGRPRPRPPAGSGAPRPP